MRYKSSPHLYVEFYCNFNGDTSSSRMFFFSSRRRHTRLQGDRSSDVCSSDLSKIAREMPVIDFTRLMNRFYRESSRVLIEGDAIIEKFVGDEIVGLFIPFLTGPEHAARAVETAQELLRVTGHGSPDGPWVPIGAGVHTGTAFVGMVGSDNTSEFTALGDPVNIAAHLASQGAIGEILVTDQAAEAAGVAADGLEYRHLSLKGHPVDALVLSAAPLAPTSA